MPEDPYMTAWQDQFKSLLRDKVYQMMKVIEVTGWSSLSHIFEDPYDDDKYRLVFEDPEFYVLNLNDPNGEVIHIDIDKLGLA